MEDSKKTKSIKATVKPPVKVAVKKTVKKNIEKKPSKKTAKVEKKNPTTQAAMVQGIAKRKNASVAKISTVARRTSVDNQPVNPEILARERGRSVLQKTPTHDVQAPVTHAGSPPKIEPSLIAHDPRGDWAEYQVAQIVPVTQMSVTSSYDAAHIPLREKMGVHKWRRNARTLRRGLVLAVLAVPLLVVGYIYSTTHKLRTEQNEVQSILAQVASAVAVPAGATPQVFVVSDPEKLNEQGGIFAGLKAGDRILYYGEIKTVVVYSMEKKKIIAVSRMPDSGSPASGGVGAFPK